MVWKPGQSGNPTGRPKGLAATAAQLREYILANTNNGQDLIDGLIALAKDPDGGRERKDALIYLASMCGGKPVQPSSVEMTVHSSETPALPSGWESMNRAQKLAWIERERVRRALPAGGDDGQE